MAAVKFLFAVFFPRFSAGINHCISGVQLNICFKCESDTFTLPLKQIRRKEKEMKLCSFSRRSFDIIHVLEFEL